jgi:ABC-type uncharacterized transport system substrate-binding protein
MRVIGLAVVLILCLSLASLAARAQQPERMRKIGVVMAYKESDPNEQVQVEAFRQELQKLGWMEGRNVQISFRYAADDPARIRALAVELLGQRPDLMVANSNFVTTILQSEVRGYSPTIRICFRSDRQRFRQRPGPARRQCHGVCQFSTFDGREMAGEAA